MTATETILTMQGSVTDAPMHVQVHAVLTDVIAVKKGRKTISFIPVSSSDQDSSTGDSQGGEETKKGPEPK
jgi:hypothetical protein